MAEHASAQMLQEPDVASLKELLDATELEESSITATSSFSPQDTLKVSPPSGCCLSSSPIWVWQRNDWGFIFYTRKDLGGSFHTYPHVGGPFQSVDEAYSAIDRYLDDLRDPTMGTELSLLDRVVRQRLYYPDGTARKCLTSQPIDERRNAMRQLVRALVDQYNDFHNLSGDLAHELKNVVCHTILWDDPNRKLYYHINFTTKTKEADGFNTGSDNLFFAEVRSAAGEHVECVINCCCMVKPFDDGCCYVCQNGMKHPNCADAYVAGRVESERYNIPCGGTRYKWKEADNDLEAEEARLRFLYRDLDDPDYDEKMRAYMRPFKLPSER